MGSSPGSGAGWCLPLEEEEEEEEEEEDKEEERVTTRPASEAVCIFFLVDAVTRHYGSKARLG